MQTPPFIAAELSYPDSVFDYYTLREEFIRLVQGLAGEVWTDYNEHDAGVTIIEQLCYALTELAYRTDVPLEALLVNPKTGQIHPEKQALYAAEQIFVMQPLTAKGYQKLLLDQLPDLLNVWVEPLATEEKSKKSTHYQIFAQAKDGSEATKICNQIKAVYHQNRNLCENLATVTLLKPTPITLHLTLAVNKEQNGEEIVAQLYAALCHLFSPTVPRYSLADLQAEGLPIEKILVETPLQNGFIKDQDLKPRPTKVVMAELLTLCLQTKGILAVVNFSLRYQNEVYEAIHEVINLKADEWLALSLENLHVILQKDSIDYQPQPQKVLVAYQNLRLTKQKTYTVQSPQTSQATGTAPDFDTYFSVQEQFPALYLLGKVGIPTFVSPERQAQAKQLQGYLFVFEQLMANHLAQLKNVHRLFSTDALLRQTYFAHALQDVAGAAYLVGQTKNGTTYFANYNQNLQATLQANDNFLERRNRFLDYLLGLYGIEFQQYSLAKFNYYFSEEILQYNLLYNKIALLKKLPSLGVRRFGAADLTKPAHANNRAGIEELMRILLHIEELYEPTNKKSSVFAVFEKYHLKLQSQMATQNFTFLTLGADVLQTQFDEVEEARLQKEFAELADQELQHFYLEKTILFTPYRTENELLNSKKLQTICPAWLQSGVQLSNYRIGRIDNDFVEIYQLLWQVAPQQWLQVGLFADRKAACYALAAFVQVCRELNRKSEAFAVREVVETQTVHFLFSDWTARFAQPAFRNLVEETISLNLPAHLLPKIHWLSPEQFRGFEGSSH